MSLSIEDKLELLVSLTKELQEQVSHLSNRLNALELNQTPSYSHDEI